MKIKADISQSWSWSWGWAWQKRMQRANLLKNSKTQEKIYEQRAKDKRKTEERGFSKSIWKDRIEA